MLYLYGVNFMQQYTYKTAGTCSKEIIFEVEDGIIRSVKFVGGCPGNTQGVAILCKDRPVNEVISLLNDIFLNLEVLLLEKITILFFEEDGIQDLAVVFQTISDDFGKQLCIHEGLMLNKNTKGSIIAHYIGVLLNSNCLNKDYSNFIELLLSAESNVTYSLMKELKEFYFNPILTKNNTKNELEVFFKNDLNVSKTAKELYLNRNSLINRLDSFSKEVGYNVQSFKFATIMLLIMNLK